VADVSDFGLDRFDAEGRSRFYDPVALPFPVSFDDRPLTTRRPDATRS
jgi:hypothetical protein